MVEYDGYVSQVGARQVGCLALEDGEAARGVALRISRAGKRLGKDVETWVVDGKVCPACGGLDAVPDARSVFAADQDRSTTSK